MNKLLRKLSLGVACLLMATFISSCQSSQASGTFEVGKNTFLLNGKPFVVKAAEVHYPRIPEPYWEQRILSCKALGMNTLCLYVFWNLHEQQPGKFDFSGNKDIAKFCRLAQKHGMYAGHEENDTHIIFSRVASGCVQEQTRVYLRSARFL